MEARFDKYVDKVKCFYRTNEEFFHTLNHVINMFEVFEKYEDEFDEEFGDYNKEDLFWSIAYHDCFYLPGYAFNEEISAEIFYREFQNIHVKWAIESTKFDFKRFYNSNPFQKLQFPIERILHDLDWYCLREYYSLVTQENAVEKEACLLSNYSCDEIRKNRLEFYKAISKHDIFVTNAFKKYNSIAKEDICYRIKDFEKIYKIK